MNHLYDMKQRTALLVLMLWFIVIATFYNVSLPLFEAPDEYDHFRFIHWLATEHQLPDMNSDLAVAGHEIWQPPLYYSLVALAVVNINMTDLNQVAKFNTSFLDGAGINVFFHTDVEHFPYQGTTLAVHVARFVSTLLGCTAVLSTYGLARLINPRLALLAAALVAFNPQFLHISGAVTNDIMTAALGGLAIWYLAWLIIEPKQSLWQYVGLGVLWGLLTLAKLSGLAFGGVIVVGLGMLAWRRRSWVPLLTGGIVTTVSAVIISGWWFWRNLLYYGNLLAWDKMLETVEPLVRTDSLSWVDTLQYAAFLRKTYWAIFGHGVLAPDYYYVFVNGLMIISALGFVLWFINRGLPQWGQPTTHIVLLLLIWSTAIGVSLLRWMRLLEATNQGRLLFPAITSLTVLQTLGLFTLLRQYRWLQRFLLAVLGTWAVALPIIAIQPAYAYPQPLNDANMIPDPLHVKFGDDIQLLGYDLASSIILPGESLVVDLYWQAINDVDENYRLALSLLDASGEVVARADTLPYGGRYATAVWQPGEPFKDSYTLSPIEPDANPGQATLLLTLHPWAQPEQPLPVMVDDLPVGSMLTISHLKIAPSAPLHYQPTRPANVVFGHQAVLTGFDVPQTIFPGQPLEIILYWEALEPDGQDYNVFVHLLDMNGQLITQADGAPQKGRYPTSIWESGEEIKDGHKMMLPADMPIGQYELAIGIYDLKTGQRLPAYMADGTAWADNRVNLFTLGVR